MTLEVHPVGGSAGEEARASVATAVGPRPPARAGAARTPKAKAAGLTVALHRRPSEVQALVPEWEALFRRAPVANPFLQPGWLLPWAECHLAEDRVVVASVRNGPELVAVAPFGLHHQVGTRVLSPLGCGRGVELTELPGILSAEATRPRALSAIFGALAAGSRDWDWVHTVLDPGDGWFQPHWLEVGGRGRMSVLHAQTRASVVLDLAPTWEEQRAGLKRNVRESLRRSRNRLNRVGRPWEVRFVGPGPEWPAAVAELARLHRLRSSAPGRITHPDAFADRNVTRLLLEAGNRLPPGALEIALLELDGRPLAAQSTLRGGGTTYLMVSGLDWIWWELGAMTEVIGEIIQAAIRRGDRAVNLSTGPVVSKLRWSERLELHQDFTLVSDQPRSQALFSAYTSLSALRRFRRERTRLHRTGSP